MSFICDITTILKLIMNIIEIWYISYDIYHRDMINDINYYDFKKPWEWKGTNHKQSTRWQHLSRLKASAFFSLQKKFSCYETQQLILVLPSGGWQSLIKALFFSQFPLYFQRKFWIITYHRGHNCKGIQILSQFYNI